MKLATWNLARPLSSERRRRIEPWLHKIDADVWVLTETHAEMTPGKEFNKVATRPPDGVAEDGARWTTVWSRLEIERAGETSDPARAVAALVKPHGRAAMVLYGSVLPWLGSPWRKFPAVDGQAFAAALAGQREDWLRLAKQYPEADLCVAGDLNQDLSTRHYYGSRKNRLALRDALQQARLSCLTADPFDPVRKHSAAHASIDHICLSERAARPDRLRWQVWPDGATPDRSVSDHYGVMVDLGS